jgi:hypothetical protein
MVEITNYYCNICRITITEGEYRYSKDRFGRALCRKHQDAERVIQSLQDNSPINPSHEPPREMQIKESTKQIEESEQNVMEKESESKIGLRGIVKKVAITTGKVIKKSATTVADTTRKAVQKRGWKDQILMRLDSKMIKQLAREKRIHPELVDKPTNDDYIDAIKDEVSLDDIIAFAKRNYVNIRDILTEIEYSKVKEENKKMLNDGSTIKGFYEQVLREIQLFQFSKSYKEELPYHMQLLGYLKAKFPNAKTDDEQIRGSSRPDITIDGIAIEIKGPTGERELQTIADKCLRYCPSHPKGVIIVLFNISAGQDYYEEWLKGMINRFPGVKIIPK